MMLFSILWEKLAMKFNTGQREITVSLRNTNYLLLCDICHIQSICGETFNIPQSSVSRILKQTLPALSSPHMLQRHIRFQMTIAELQINKEGFFSNCPLVFDDEDKIIDVVARWPGSTHDSRILRQSGLWQLTEGNQLPPGEHYLLGDSGFQCKRRLLTSYLQARNQTQENYNRSHRLTRSKVERGIGQLKRIWNLLHSQVRLSPEKTCQPADQIYFLMHDICKDYNVPAVDGALPAPPIYHAVANNGPLADGLRYRDLTCTRYF